MTILTAIITVLVIAVHIWLLTGSSFNTSRVISWLIPDTNSRLILISGIVLTVILLILTA